MNMGKKAFLTALIDQLQEINGKKSLQKLVYLARAFGLETGYSFRFHYYGPYSDSLAADFEQLLETDRVSLSDKSRYKYQVSDDLSQDPALQELDADKQEKIRELIECFGSKSPSDLELYATIYFIDHHEKYVLGNGSVEDVLEKTYQAKPKYKKLEIKKAYKDLEDWGLLYQLQ
ncbi:hypothetical protein [Desulfosporosinus youngiae]|uniref:Antitoxin SocA-like Panacea domain-containing protein n=1 Tax=Desulfosporosinus youngiae DSM 17734 TaxID=768710 RepID=H5Y5F6_9FIRM|nr:hypothetical protein [Desulfosporosinus youngiae]EHQ90406.1 hypothetical protein DesyoDRAFT_3382 [Desulfosporosinus youngiae DSM 17734]